MIIIAAAAVASFALSSIEPAVEAQGSCPPSPAAIGWDQSSTNRFRLYATTYKSTCNRVMTEGWTDIAGFGCEIGTYQSNLNICYNMSTGSNSTVQPYNNGYGQTYGHFQGGHNYGAMPETAFELTSVGDVLLTSQQPGEWPDNYCEYEWDYEYGQWVCVSPIIIATTAAQDYTLTSAKDGVMFDMNGDGLKTKIAWTKGGSEVAFLARDVDGDGRITNGRELFGSFTVPGLKNGFIALAELQFKESGVRRGDVTALDPMFDKLLLWTDRNHNGESEPEELRPFGELFAAIGLAYKDHKRKDGFGNLFAYEGYVLLRTGPGRNPTTSGLDARKRNRRIYDVLFAGVK
jgi:hypothetical protein